MRKPSVDAIAYTRVSSEEQSREGVSLAAQEARVRAYAVAKGLELVEVLADAGYSGSSLRRPALENLLARCRRRSIGHVIVWRLDRLTRRTRHLLDLVEDLFITRQIELHSVSESLDTSTPHGRFVLTLFGGLAQMERELIGDRTRDALAFKREKGQPTSHPPLGFRANGSREQMVPVPEELLTVREILSRRSAGGSYAGIARELNLEGQKTKLGGRWHASTVRAIVKRRPFYDVVLNRFSGTGVHVRSDV